MTVANQPLTVSEFMNSRYLKGLIIVRVYRLITVHLYYVIVGLNGHFESPLSQKCLVETKFIQNILEKNSLFTQRLSVVTNKPLTGISNNRNSLFN